MYKCYPDAKKAHLKSGGNFPYLSRSSEVNLMIQVNILYFLIKILTTHIDIHTLQHCSHATLNSTLNYKEIE